MEVTPRLPATELGSGLRWTLRNLWQGPTDTVPQNEAPEEVLGSRGNQRPGRETGASLNGGREAVLKNGGFEHASFNTCHRTWAESYRASLRHQLLTGGPSVSVLAFLKKADQFLTGLALWCVGTGVQDTPDGGTTACSALAARKEGGLPLPEFQPDSPQMTGLG